MGRLETGTVTTVPAEQQQRHFSLIINRLKAIVLRLVPFVLAVGVFHV